jgi:hypothetical protein
MHFTIDSDNNITAHDAAPAAQDGVLVFASEKGLAKASAEWPISRLVEVWNSFAGVPPFGDLKPVKKFENREKATRRIWAAIQELELELAPAPAKHTPTPAMKAAPKAPRAAQVDALTADQAATDAKAPREGSKQAVVVGMITQQGGATLGEIVAATGWQRHTVRGFISTLGKKTGLVITSTRRESDKARVYAAS